MTASDSKLFQCKYKPRAAALAAAALAIFATMPASVRAQEKPLLSIDHDCKRFAIADTGQIACSEPRTKKVKKVVISRDDVFVAGPNGHEKQLVDGDKFMPVPPPETYNIESFAWSPDGRRIAMSMTTVQPTDVEEPAGGKREIALLDNDGHEIKVSGSKDRFIQNGTNGAWLGDNQTVVYLTGIGPYQITRLNPNTGETTKLYAGHNFDSVTWDSKNSRAYALSQDLSISGRKALMQLDLVHEGLREIARMDELQGQVMLSPSGNKIAFFNDADTLEVRDLANPQTPVRVRAGFGQFAWGSDEKHILLKRGPVEKSGDLVWVGLYDGTFVPALHGLEYHSFAIGPTGQSVAVTEPGRAVLRVYSLQ
jgi:hypothetical protein